MERRSRAWRKRGPALRRPRPEQATSKGLERTPTAPRRLGRETGVPNGTARKSRHPVTGKNGSSREPNGATPTSGAGRKPPRSLRSRPTRRPVRPSCEPGKIRFLAPAIPGRSTATRARTASAARGTPAWSDPSGVAWPDSRADRGCPDHRSHSTPGSAKAPESPAFCSGPRLAPKAKARSRACSAARSIRNRRGSGA